MNGNNNVTSPLLLLAIV